MVMRILLPVGESGVRSTPDEGLRPLEDVRERPYSASSGFAAR